MAPECGTDEPRRAARATEDRRMHEGAGEEEALKAAGIETEGTRLFTSTYKEGAKGEHYVRPAGSWGDRRWLDDLRSYDRHTGLLI